MFLFLKLVLAHLIADFILQFEELYRLKVKSGLGHFFHALIHAAVMLALAFPYLRPYPLIGVYLIVLAVIHHFQDVLKYGLQKKHPEAIFWCFTIDQVFHFLFLSTILLFPAAHTPLGFNNPRLDLFYQGDLWTLYACAYIAATFKMTYLLHAFRLSFVPSSRPDHFITSPEVAWDILERGWILSCVLFAPLPLGFAAALPAGILRLFSSRRRNLLDFILSFTAAAACGIFFRAWITALGA